jgi:hypothetical protein
MNRRTDAQAAHRSDGVSKLPKNNEGQTFPMTSQLRVLLEKQHAAMMSIARMNGHF